MTLVLKLIGLVVLGVVAAAALFAADSIWNGSRLFYVAMGRDALVRDCTPATRDALAGRGFSPTDLVFDPRPSISAALGPQGRIRTFDSGFTFSDGTAGVRVDGHVACVARGRTIQVDVEVDDLPRRLT